jgi:hypothetical protein
MNRPRTIFLGSLIAMGLACAWLSMPIVRVSAQETQGDDAAAAAAFEKMVPVFVTLAV